MSTGFQNVHIRVNDAATGKPTPVRIRFVGSDGQYYAPFGRLTEFATGPGEDVGGNLLLGDKKYAYIDGTCEIRLPVGMIEMEIHKGPEYLPVHEKVELKQGKLSMRFEIRRWIHMRHQGWYSGDTHCFYMTPHAALLEAQGEDIAVVNLLVRLANFSSYSQYSYPVISNILSFSGQTPCLETSDNLVSVNTFNEHPFLGELTLLHTHRTVYPLTFGSGSTGIDDWNLADWCEQCHRKGGLVVAEDFFGKQSAERGELFANVILNNVDAVDVFDPAGPDFIHPSYLNYWYELLDCGLTVPLSGGSGKWSNRILLGNVRTYAFLGADQPLNYKTWIEAVRSGKSFVTNGPILSLAVNGQPPGSNIDLPVPQALVAIKGWVRSLRRVTSLEIIYNNEVISRTPCHSEGGLFVANVEMDFPVGNPGWVCARTIYGENETHSENGIAHTSPIVIQIDGQKITPPKQTLERLLTRVDRQLEFVQLNCRFENDQQRQRMVNVYLAAKQRLGEMLAAHGISHR